MSLKFPLIYMFENEKEDFDWLKLLRIMDILAPLRDASLDLQKGKVGPKDAVDVLSFLNQLAGTESAVTSAIRLFLQMKTTALPTLPNFDAHFAEKKSAKWAR